MWLSKRWVCEGAGQVKAQGRGRAVQAVGALCAVPLLLALGACQKPGAGGAEPAAASPAARGASAPRPPQVVSLHTVGSRDVAVEFSASGSLAALNTVELRPQVASTVRRVAVREGQSVRAGELLFQLDDRNEQANLDKARATLARDQATLADLQRQWQRAQDLRAQNFIAQSAADSVLTQLEAQRALLLADEAAVRSAEVAVSLMSLRAPISGRTGQVSVNPGSLVQPSGAALVTIAQLDPISVGFALPEAQWATLLNEAGGPAGLKDLPLSVTIGSPSPAGRVGGSGGGGSSAGASAPAASAAAPGGSAPGGAMAGAATGAPTLKGRLVFVDNLVDSSTGTLRLKGELPNPGQKLWPGQYVTVRLKLRTLANVPVLPQAALIIRGAERVVYVVDADGLAQLRKVRVRAPQGDWVAVEGVNPGEKVVLEGKQNLRPGTPVKEAPAKAPAAAGSAASTVASGAAR